MWKGMFDAIHKFKQAGKIEESRDQFSKALQEIRTIGKLFSGAQRKHSLFPTNKFLLCMLNPLDFPRACI